MMQKEKIGEQVALKGSKDTWINLGTEANSELVENAVGSHILGSGGWNAFMGYYKNEKFGEDFFFKAASKNSGNAEGTMKKILDNYPASQIGLSLSELTHKWVDDNGWTRERNQLEHHIGMFLLASKVGIVDADMVGNANEARGLFFNDRQSGNMKRALFGQPTSTNGPTAFEWKDIKANREGLALFRTFSLTPDAKKYSSYLRWEAETKQKWREIRKRVK